MLEFAKKKKKKQKSITKGNKSEKKNPLVLNNYFSIFYT